MVEMETLIKMKGKQSIWSRIKIFAKSDDFFTIMMMILGLLTILFAIVETL